MTLCVNLGKVQSTADGRVQGGWVLGAAEEWCPGVATYRMVDKEWDAAAGEGWCGGEGKGVQCE